MPGYGETGKQDTSSRNGGNGSHDRGGNVHRAAATQPTEATQPSSTNAREQAIQTIAESYTKPIQQVGGDARDAEQFYLDNPIEYEGIDFEATPEADLAFMVNKGLLQRDLGTGEIVEGPNVRHPETLEIVPRDSITTTETGGDGITTLPVETDITPTVEDTGLTEAENRALIDAYGYGTTVPTEIGALPYDVAGQRDLSGLIDPRMQRAYAENVQLMTAADGGRAGYYDGELVEDDDEETIRAQALASLPEYRMFSVRRKAMLGGRMNYNQGGIVSRQPFFLGGIGKVFKSITKPIKKIAKSPIGKAALMYAGLGAAGHGLTGATGGWKNLAWLKPGAVKSAWLGSKPFLSSTAAMKGAAASGGTSGILGKWGLTAGKGSWLPTGKGAMASIIGLSSIPLWAKPENWDEMDEAEQEAWLKKYYAEVAAKKAEYGETIPTEFQPLPYQFAAKGGRIGYRTGKGVESIPVDQMQSIQGQQAGGEYNRVMELMLKIRENIPLTDEEKEELKGLMQTLNMSEGGRIGYRGGKDVASLQAGAPDIKYEGDMRMANMDEISVDQMQDIKGQQASTMSSSMIELISYLETLPFDKKLRALEMLPPEIRAEVEARLGLAQGGRVAAQEGGLMDLGGLEKDYRQEGGFVPIGGQEKADDVPARLSKNEFVFTADAVRAAGGGDIDEGAAVMERLMENLEAGGKVSEESQGLEGARNMFANTQQLEKRII